MAPRIPATTTTTAQRQGEPRRRAPPGAGGGTRSPWRWRGGADTATPQLVSWLPQEPLCRPATGAPGRTGLERGQRQAGSGKVPAGPGTAGRCGTGTVTSGSGRPRRRSGESTLRRPLKSRSRSLLETPVLPLPSPQLPSALRRLPSPAPARVAPRAAENPAGSASQAQPSPAGSLWHPDPRWAGSGGGCGEMPAPGSGAAVQSPSGHRAGPDLSVTVGLRDRPPLRPSPAQLRE